ncbi:ATP synthase F1 subunit gamma [Risungbinella massiliensis]|uniref:ATP synthase F1 subunit gamma n=1 Tax=Risungbinella massiliensis TaxID=1329796 RepID=UPI0005CC2068|nr:ATP synthase F1 subunit gamma [Risungbinella massiliensis]
MANMKAIKQKIRSYNKSKQITKAMQMVAASNLRRAQEQAQASRPYAEKMREVITSLSKGADANHPMLATRPVKRTGYLVITSDRGLAGGYNSNLLRLLLETLNAKHKNQADTYSVFVIGRKGLEYLKKKNVPIIDSVTGMSDRPYFSDIKSIAYQAVEFFSEEKYDELHLVYNEFVNPVVQRPVVKQLLPLASGDFEQDHAKSLPAYEFEPSQEEVLAEILPRYAETLVYSAVLEAKASEFSARMNAMSAATDNANELIKKLTLEFNRARQAAITQEIAEIVGGAAAL